MGRIKLPLTVGVDPLATTQIIEYIEVNEDISHNVILGRPVPKEFRVITSIYHFLMKFPTPNGVGYVKSFQYESRKCYNKEVRAAEKADRLNLIEEKSYKEVLTRSFSKEAVKFKRPCAMHSRWWNSYKNTYKRLQFFFGGGGGSTTNGVDVGSFHEWSQ